MINTVGYGVFFYWTKVALNLIWKSIKQLSEMIVGNLGSLGTISLCSRSTHGISLVCDGDGNELQGWAKEWSLGLEIFCLI